VELRRHSRRDFLALSAAGLGALALPKAAWPEASRGAAARTTWAFVSEPSLKPPALDVTTLTSTAPGYVFCSTLTGPGQRGPMMVDNHGNVVWFRRTDQVAINVRPQAFRGQRVLTWWQGDIDQELGYGKGVGLIVDRNYQTVASVKAGNGYQIDVHEFLLTAKGTALVTIYSPTTVDLTSVGGPSGHTTLDSIVQEIDIATGKVLFEWHSLDHVPLTDSYSPVLDPYDYFHINSIDVALDGNLLVSARNTSCIYKLDRKTGAVIWRLGGRSSDFAVEPSAGFMYQHDARAQPDGTMTMFDDGSGDLTHASRGLRLAVDEQARTAALVAAYPHPTPITATAMGNAQVLPGGGMMIGWGSEPYMTEFGPDGDVRFDAGFPGAAKNYRTYREPWIGEPSLRPALAVHGTTAYASWNGSTETAWWRVEAGSSRTALRQVALVPKQGFETAIPLRARPRLASLTALDAKKRPLASSRVIAPF
jgi:hypothetical protein